MIDTPRIKTRRPMIILPDAMDDTRLIITKCCSYLRLTSELEVASRVASRTNREMILAVPPTTEFDDALSEFIVTHGISVVRVEE